MSTVFLESLLHKTNISFEYRGVLGVLAELSCSPWKFDLLWDIWPTLGISPATADGIARELFDIPQSSDEGIVAAVAFDDLTIFHDVVGAENLSQLDRPGHRMAYLTLRSRPSAAALDAGLAYSAMSVKV